VTITVLFHATSKPGKEEQMRRLTAEMMRVSRDEDAAVAYTFHQKKKAPREFMLYEQWRDLDHAQAHIDNMKRHFGEPPPGAKLPARLEALVESHSMVFYDAVA
jgi:quinol monooxygenase YgiN